MYYYYLLLIHISVSYNHQQRTSNPDTEPGEREEKVMTIAGSMTISIYDSEIRNIYHDLGYWIINLCYWYPDTKYTKEQAIEAFKNKDK